MWGKMGSYGYCLDSLYKSRLSMAISPPEIKLHVSLEGLTCVTGCADLLPSGGGGEIRRGGNPSSGHGGTVYRVENASSGAGRAIHRVGNPSSAAGRSIPVSHMANMGGILVLHPDMGFAVVGIQGKINSNP